MATFCVPMVLSNIAPVPTAVLESDPVPLVRANAPAPTPVLKLASPAKKSEYQPTPVFPIPAPSRARALHPSAVVYPGEHPSGAGTAAFVRGARAKKPSANGIVANMLVRFFIN